MTKIWRKKEWEEAEKISPSYYKKGIEVTDFILSHDLGWCEGNIIKYIVRHKIKHDDPIQDLKKAKWYLEKLIKNSKT
tara:strand:+ start:1527 stop:1760 length:234 start_codon:yes stop_codon:yes gene_type:complete